MHVVRPLAPRGHGEDHSKDIDFNASGIRTRWDAGCAETMRVLQATPWEKDEEGFIMHEAAGGVMATTGHLAPDAHP